MKIPSIGTLHDGLTSGAHCKGFHSPEETAGCSLKHRKLSEFRRALPQY